MVPTNGVDGIGTTRYSHSLAGVPSSEDGPRANDTVSYNYNKIDPMVAAVGKEGTNHVYDGNLVLQERDGYNLPRATYTRGNDLSETLEGAGGIGGLIARTDHASGTSASLIPGEAVLVAEYQYDPYGNLISLSGPLAEENLYRFSSKEVHPRSGLVYYLYRYYDPNLQRWLNRDPIGELGGINLYGFVENSPISMFDGLGLAGWGWPFVTPTPGPLVPPPDPVDCVERIAAEVGRLRGTLRNDPRNRYLHCLASCRIKRQCPGGRFSAWIAGDWAQDPWYKVDDGSDNADPGDRLANRIGRGCPRRKSCEEHCTDALNGGRFYPEPPPVAFINRFYRTLSWTFVF